MITDIARLLALNLGAACLIVAFGWSSFSLALGEPIVGVLMMLTAGIVALVVAEDYSLIICFFAKRQKAVP